MKRVSPEDVFEVEDGVRVRAELDDYMVLWAFTGGFQREPAFGVSRALLRPGDIVFDVGANVGLWALGAARAAGPSGQTFAFEPVPNTYARLLRNIEINGLAVFPQNIALAGEPGSLHIFESSNGNSGGSGLLRGLPTDDSLSVRAETLDGFIGRTGLDGVAFVKIDVEGAEPLVLSGGTSMLAGDRCPIVMFEVNQRAMGLGFAPTDTATFLAAQGYVIHECIGGRLRPIEPTHSILHGDLVAAKAVHADRISPLLAPLQ